MTANINFHRVKDWQGLRGFVNLFHKENRAWWRTRRWWINALLWMGVLGGLASVMLFMLPAVVATNDSPEVAAAGGAEAFGLQMAYTIFFEMGTMALALGVIVLNLDQILEEKQAGVTEWLLAKPVARRSYVLAKLVASVLATLVLLLLLPASVMYLLLSIRTGALIPWQPFLNGVSIMTLHTMFYLVFTLMLGTFFNSRVPILGVALAFLMAGNLIGGFIRPLMVISPWILPKSASWMASGSSLPDGMLTAPLIATCLWCLFFVFVTVRKFEKMEF